MSYIYHLKPNPFEGTSLVPLNMMDSESELYKGHARKYLGREHLMDEVIPLLNCKWNDVVQFSALDPQKIVDKLKTIQDDFHLSKTEYFKIHVSQMIHLYEAVIFERDLFRAKGSFAILQSEVVRLSHSYKEALDIPSETIRYWNNAKKDNGKFLWFPYIPHILVKGIINTKDFEVCELKV